jgi:hypothetical protein
MFFIGTVRKPTHLFDVFFITLFFCTLLGFIGLHIIMYEGWRHAYCIYGSFLYVAVLGLERSFAFFQTKRIVLRRGFACVVAASMVYLFAWIAVYHPYQYVYFNKVGKQFAEKNFTLDYWHVSFVDLIRHVLASDDRLKIRFAIGGPWEKEVMLTNSERERIIWENVERADYYIQDTRMSYKERVPRPGFIKQTAVTVDGMEISVLFKRIEPSGVFYNDAWSKIKRFESNVDDNFAAMYDRNYETRWSTNRPQKPGDYMMFEFNEDVNYNYLFLDLANWLNGDYPRDLHVYVSADGNTWQTVLTSFTAQVYCKLETEPYRFLKLENTGSDEYFWWSVSEMKFGYATKPFQQ